LSQHTPPVHYIDGDEHREVALNLGFPLDIHPLVGMVSELTYVTAVAVMDDHAAAGAGEAYHRIARNRPATAREGHHGPLGTANREPLSGRCLLPMHGFGGNPGEPLRHQP